MLWPGSDLPRKVRKRTFWICALSEDSDQPAHSRSLIRIITRRFLSSQGCTVSSCAVWFESLFGAHFRWYVFALCASLLVLGHLNPDLTSANIWTSPIYYMPVGKFWWVSGKQCGPSGSTTLASLSVWIFRKDAVVVDVENDMSQWQTVQIEIKLDPHNSLRHIRMYEFWVDCLQSSQSIHTTKRNCPRDCHQPRVCAKLR